MIGRKQSVWSRRYDRSVCAKQPNSVRRSVCGDSSAPPSAVTRNEYASCAVVRTSRRPRVSNSAVRSDDVPMSMARMRADDGSREELRVMLNG